MNHFLLEVTAKSKAAAKDQVLEELGLAEADVDIEQIGGNVASRIFKLGSGDVTVRAFLKNQEIPTEDIAAIVALNIIRKMGFEAEVTEKSDLEGKAYVKIDSSKSGLLIGKRGKTLESIQFLTDLICGRLLTNKKKIILDIGDYRAKRQASLEKLAQNMAEKVVQSGRPRILEPMNPFERRIIHMTLQEHEAVYTHSNGTGLYKKVRIGMLPTEITKAEYLEREAAGEDMDAVMRKMRPERNNNRGRNRHHDPEEYDAEGDVNYNRDRGEDDEEINDEDDDRFNR